MSKISRICIAHATTPAYLKLACMQFLSSWPGHSCLQVLFASVAVRGSQVFVDFFPHESGCMHLAEVKRSCQTVTDEY